MRLSLIQGLLPCPTIIEIQNVMQVPVIMHLINVNVCLRVWSNPNDNLVKYFALSSVTMLPVCQCSLHQTDYLYLF